MARVLYVNHRRQQCGVYEFGKGIGEALAQSTVHSFTYCECDSQQELVDIYNAKRPDVIIYNYHPETMTWIKTGKYDAPITYKLKAVHIGTIHEVYQGAADAATDTIFDFHIGPDPTLLLKNPIVYKTGRLLPAEPVRHERGYDIPVVGSFGFATNGKGFDKIITRVQEEFDEAIIRLNIPFAKFGDEDGSNARRIAKQCQDLVTKKGIKLEIDHTYLEKQDLLDFLGKNSINVFLYDDMANRGISSATDWAICAGRPLAISSSRLFRHLFHCRPTVQLEQSSLKAIMANGTAPVEHLWSEWSATGLRWDYERIVTSALQKPSLSSIGKRSLFGFYKEKLMLRIGKMPFHSKQLNVWVRTNETFSPLPFRPGLTYQPVALPASHRFNGILDNAARVLYAPAINFLSEILPALIAKKIPEANVQQAFVLDTAARMAGQYEHCRMLAVGSFEDTAAQGLKMLNYHIDEIDPILNYDLATFKTKPGITPGMYDIIISTSVIEHVPDDEGFVSDIAYLLKPGGVAIITCDYNNDYKKGDDIPEVDCRFYTKTDLQRRLLSKMPGCRLVDEPDWDCDNPDFRFMNKYVYTFATFVVRKSP